MKKEGESEEEYHNRLEEISRTKYLKTMKTKTIAERLEEIPKAEKARRMFLMEKRQKEKNQKKK